MSDPTKDYERKGDALIELLIEKLESLDKKLDDHMKEESTKITELLEAWNTGKHVVWFIKIAATIGVSIALGWAWITDHFTIGLK